MSDERLRRRRENDAEGVGEVERFALVAEEGLERQIEEKSRRDIQNCSSQCKTHSKEEGDRQAALARGQPLEHDWVDCQLAVRQQQI